MAPRYTTRMVTVVETTLPCQSCKQDMTRSIAEPGMIFCGTRGCQEFGKMRKEV